MGSKARLAVVFSGALPLLAILGTGAALAAQDIGYPGPSLAGAGPTVGTPTVTESKPESKVWYHDGSWWGSLWNAGAQSFRIHRLDRSTHAWVDTGVEIESRPDSHSDALWDGTKLYIASHEFGEGPGTPGQPLLLLRYSYAAGTYSLDAGFPVTIGSSTTESMVIAKDSTQTLWAVWKQSLRVYYSYTMGSDLVWSTPAVLPSCTSDFASDDICSIVHFAGNRIGVMWSDKNLGSFLFARHFDGDPGDVWQPIEGALRQWDDHIDLAADSAGRVFAAIKNSAEEIKLLVRPVGGVGGWQQYLVADRYAEFTRPIVVLDEAARLVRVFAAWNGMIQEKTSSMDTIAFDTGLGTTVIQDADGTVNSPSSTKQSVNATTGLVVLAANESVAGSYWHHEIPGVTPGNGLVLGTILPGTAATTNEFKVTGATPNRYVNFFTGAAGSSTITTTHCPAGIPMGLATPYQLLGSVRANAQGVAVLRLFIPRSVAGRTVYFQAVEPYSCRATNLVAEIF